MLHGLWNQPPILAPIRNQTSLFEINNLPIHLQGSFALMRAKRDACKTKQWRPQAFIPFFNGIPLVFILKTLIETLHCEQQDIIIYSDFSFDISSPVFTTSICYWFAPSRTNPIRLQGNVWMAETNLYREKSKTFNVVHTPWHLRSCIFF